MKLRAGLIGAGTMGRNHARILGGLQDVEFVAIADPVIDGLLKGTTVVKTVEELISQGIDYAVVACPTGLHEEIGLALADAGIHALIEKPLADTVEGAQRLRNAFVSKGLIGGVGHIERYNPALQSLKSRLEAGDLGEIFQVVTRRQGPFPGRIADVGVVKDLGTHDLDLTAWVSGRDYESVSAFTARKSGRAHEDMVSVTAMLSDGLIANHLVNWLSPFKERSTVVTGERGSFVADTLTADLTFYGNGVIATEWAAVQAFRGVSEGDMTRFALTKREPLLVEHEWFRNAVLGEDTDIVTLEQGLRTVEVAAAILESAELGQTISTKREAQA